MFRKVAPPKRGLVQDTCGNRQNPHAPSFADENVLIKENIAVRPRSLRHALAARTPDLTRQSSIDLMPRWRHEKKRLLPRETNLNQSVSRKVEGKSHRKNVSKGKRFRTARRTDCRSFGWYEKAASSIGIRVRTSQRLTAG